MVPTFLKKNWCVITSFKGYFKTSGFFSHLFPDVFFGGLLKFRVEEGVDQRIPNDIAQSDAVDEKVPTGSQLERESHAIDNDLE